MLRFHRAIYFPHIDKVKKLTDSLNGKSFTYSRHAIDTMKYRYIDTMAILQFVKGITLSANDVFEYYIEGEEIQRLCYRIKYTEGTDVILVISKDKKIITIYTNESTDEHFTLNYSLYQKSVSTFPDEKTSVKYF